MFIRKSRAGLWPFAPKHRPTYAMANGKSFKALNGNGWRGLQAAAKASHFIENEALNEKFPLLL
jgi:hypothetical protein